jgi:uncharacterized peroxidase-related enzyme
MSRLNAINPDTATGKAAELLDTVKANLGSVPNLTRVMANQPAVLEAFLALGGALAKGAFDPKTREAIALAVAGANSCDYCASAHSAISRSLKVDPAEIEHRLAGRSDDPKLHALLLFARKIVDRQGLVSDADIADVKAAGYDDAAITEVTANVVANIFTNYINHVADTEIDFPVVRTRDVAPAA